MRLSARKAHDIRLGILLARRGEAGLDDGLFEQLQHLGRAGVRAWGRTRFGRNVKVSAVRKMWWSWW